MRMAASRPNPGLHRRDMRRSKPCQLSAVRSPGNMATLSFFTYTSPPSDGEHQQPLPHDSVGREKLLVGLGAVTIRLRFVMLSNAESLCADAPSPTNPSSTMTATAEPNISSSGASSGTRGDNPRLGKPRPTRATAVSIRSYVPSLKPSSHLPLPASASLPISRVAVEYFWTVASILGLSR